VKLSLRTSSLVFSEEEEEEDAAADVAAAVVVFVVIVVVILLRDGTNTPRLILLFPILARCFVPFSPVFGTTTNAILVADIAAAVAVVDAVVVVVVAEQARANISRSM